MNINLVIPTKYKSIDSMITLSTWLCYHVQLSCNQILHINNSATEYVLQAVVDTDTYIDRQISLNTLLTPRAAGIRLPSSSAE